MQVSPTKTEVAGQSLVIADKICVSENKLLILRDVSLSVHPGEIITIIGPNGGGKSTLVKTLLGIRKPDSGTVTRKTALRVGYVPQKLNIDQTLPLAVRRLMTLTQKAQLTDILKVLTETGADHLIDRRVHALSGGELQRVLLARALLRKPELLVLDEPVQGVDFQGEQAIYELIENIRSKRNCGIILISHDLHIVMRASNRVICLNGHVCCEGKPSDVAQNPAYAELFGPRSHETVAFYTHHHSHENCDHDHHNTGSEHRH